MNQIYNFEAKQPPVLNESLLREELKKRQLHRQTTMAAVAGVLTQLCFLLCAILLADHFPLLSLGCMVYVIVSATGSTIIAILLHSRTGRQTLRQS